MAITTDTNRDEMFRQATAQASGDAVLFQLRPSLTYTVSAVVTSAGTATMKIYNGGDTPTDFSNFSEAQDGTKAANFMREVTGCTWVGLDVASGAFTINVTKTEI